MMNYNWINKGPQLLNEIKNTILPENALSIWYVGQMGIILKFRGRIIAIDPVFNDLTDSFGHTRRNYPAPFSASEFDCADYLIGTHGHADHINMQTLQPIHKANPQTCFLIPAPEVHMLENRGIPRTCITAAIANEPQILEESLVVTPIAAAHEEYKEDQEGHHYFLGYVIQCGPFRIYHAGDTLVTNRLKSDLAKASAYDLALLPINGRDEIRHSHGIVGNMNYQEAADFAHRICAKMTIPLHYDMVKGNGEDPIHFAEYMDRQYPKDGYRIMKLGEQLVFSF